MVNKKEPTSGGVLWRRVFAKIRGIYKKHLCQSVFFNEAAGVAWNLIIKETLAQVFPCEFL